MKWIGQHIWDFISRFRNDVYLESISASAGDNLGLDINGKIVKTGRSNVLVSQFNVGTNFHQNIFMYIPLLPYVYPSAITNNVNTAHRFIAPRAGKISSITYAYSRDFDINRKFSLHLNDSSTVIGTEVEITSHTTGSNYASKHTVSCPANWEFVQNDRVAIAFKDSAYTDNNIISILIEYDN